MEWLSPLMASQCFPRCQSISAHTMMNGDVLIHVLQMHSKPVPVQRRCCKIKIAQLVPAVVMAPPPPDGSHGIGDDMVVD
jgi:hypothetical protein